MASISENVKKLIQRLKAVKHIEIIIAVIAVALMIFIFAGVKRNTDSTPTNVGGSNATTGDYAVTSIAEWEKKLSAILSEIDGVGRAEVMITAKGTTEKITANTKTTNSNNSQNTSGNVTSSTNITESPVLVNNNGKSEPYIIKEIMPEILGVIVVADGADNAVTKLAIMRAVQTVLQVSSSCVEIYPMK